MISLFRDRMRFSTTLFCLVAIISASVVSSHGDIVPMEFIGKYNSGKCTTYPAPGEQDKTSRELTDAGFSCTTVGFVYQCIDANAPREKINETWKRFCGYFVGPIERYTSGPGVNGSGSNGGESRDSNTGEVSGEIRVRVNNGFLDCQLSTSELARKHLTADLGFKCKATGANDYKCTNYSLTREVLLSLKQDLKCLDGSEGPVNTGAVFVKYKLKAGKFRATCMAKSSDGSAEKAIGILHDHGFIMNTETSWFSSRSVNNKRQLQAVYDSLPCRKSLSRPPHKFVK